MDHSWTVFCHRTIADRDSNRLTLVDTIDNVTLQGPMPDVQDGVLVVVPLDCVLVSHWTRSDLEEQEKATCKITLLSPSGAVVPFVDPSPLILSVDLTEMVTMRVHNRLPGLPVGEQGRYTFHVEVASGDEWRTVARVPYILKIEGAKQKRAPTKPRKRRKQ